MGSVGPPDLAELWRHSSLLAPGHASSGLAVARMSHGAQLQALLSGCSSSQAAVITSVASSQQCKHAC